LAGWKAAHITVAQDCPVATVGIFQPHYVGVIQKTSNNNYI